MKVKDLLFKFSNQNDLIFVFVDPENNEEIDKKTYYQVLSKLDKLSEQEILSIEAKAEINETSRFMYELNISLRAKLYVYVNYQF